MPTVSVVIPTNRAGEVLERCLHSLAGQNHDPCDIEVIVVFNGGAAGPADIPDGWPFRLVTAELPEANIAAAQNVALGQATGRWLVLLNDDVLVDSHFIEAHLAAHRQLNRPALVLGRSIWRRYRDQTVLDELIEATSMIFFYDQMQPHAWYNFRHAWNLNLSLPRGCLGTLRFDTRLGPFFYEDLELAYRLQTGLGLRVWYAPECLLLHDHRYSLAGYLERERRMGAAAVRLWQCNPDCFRATYRRDLDDEFVSYCRQFVEYEGAREDELLSGLRAVVEQPATTLPEDAQARAALLRVLYQAHLPLKRLAFRRGLLAACGERAPADLCPA